MSVHVWLLAKGSHADQVLPELEKLGPADVRAFLPALLGGLHIEAMVHGNITGGNATELAWRLYAELGGASLTADARPTERCVQLPKGCRFAPRCDFAMARCVESEPPLLDASHATGNPGGKPHLSRCWLAEASGAGGQQ